MHQNPLYERILGLSTPWFVSNVDLDERSGRVEVQVECEASASLCCPQCGQPAPRYDKRRRQWRHLDTCQFQTKVVADVPRVRCPDHGCLTIQVPWAEGNSRYTALFEALVIQWLKEASIQAVSRQLQLSWTAIDGIMKRAVRRGLVARTSPDVRFLSVDETAFRKGHDYVTILSNHQGQVIIVEDGKSADSLSRCYLALTEAQRASIESVSMDMSRAYRKATFAHVEKAHRKIAFDHFHIAQALSDALNATRKSELHSADASLRRIAHQSRYAWLKRRDRLDERERATLNWLSSQFSNTTIAWYLKEKARKIWKGNRVRGARAAWQEWIRLAKASDIRPVVTVAEQVEEKLWGILNAMRLRASNGLAEALNSKIRGLKVRAKGYRSKTRFKTAILFHFGGLEMAPNPLK